MTEDRKFTNYKGEEIIITKERKWQLLADCIRSGQVEDRELQEIVENIKSFDNFVNELQRCPP